jgi:ubiquinone/menaquinone biosynthesis C-methylase UbiE
MEQLELLHLQPDTIWVDAGCGIGTFTFPLSKIVRKVIAVDRNESRIAQLKKLIPNKSAIFPRVSDFTSDRYVTEPVDGVLFGFSLHYQRKPLDALNNAYKQLKQNGSIVIFDYCRKIPLPWVPYPFPLKKSSSSLKRSGFTEKNIIFQNKRFYILRGEKNPRLE